MFTAQELMEAVAGYQPVAPATLKGWTYGIKGFEDKPVAEVDKKICQPQTITTEPFGVQAELCPNTIGFTAEPSGRSLTNKWKLSIAIHGVVHSKG